MPVTALSSPMMPSTPAKPLHLPWHSAEHYWLCVFPKLVDLNALSRLLAPLGYQQKDASLPYLQLAAPRQWGAAWGELSRLMLTESLTNKVDVAVLAGDHEPDARHVELSRKTVRQMQDIADNLWLGDAVLSGNVVCYLQPVLSAPDKIYGYESFARVRTAGGSVVAGEAIVSASRILGIEYGIDRLLQVNAIKTFVASECAGFLFVNFFPGFIQRPEVYLEGLTETVRSHGVVSRHIVLDFTRSERQHDVHHLKRVTEYCRAKGYAIALDDIESAENAQSLVTDIKPDYLKLDMKLVHRIDEAQERHEMAVIVDLCHRHGVTVVAEGVETEEMYQQLKKLNIDLFQGYHFAPPLPMESVQKQGRA